jgi:regulator of sigma E protease
MTTSGSAEPAPTARRRLQTAAILIALVALAAANGLLQWETIVTIVLFIVILGVTVILHELGHFLAARIARVRVLEFGIGFPPRAAVLRDKGDTVYTLNWLPLGGFVKLEGEDGDEAADPRSFAAQRLPTKVIILAAGVAMNLVLAFVIFAGITLTGDPALGVYVPYVDPTSPAAAAGIKPGDVIGRVDGQAYSAFGSTSILTALGEKVGQTVTLHVAHPDGTQSDVVVTLRTAAELKANPDLGALGIGRRGETDPVTGQVTVPALPLEIRSTSDRVNYPVATALQLSVDRTVSATQLIVSGVGDLLGNFVTHPTQAPQASGPIGIAAEIGNVFFTVGPIYTLFLAGILAANLAVVNILPIPPLDGGRILILVLKSALRGRLSLRAERLTYAVGLAVVLGFVLWVTAFDVARQFGANP